MAIAKNPNRNTSSPSSDRKAEVFIAGVDQALAPERDKNKKPTLIRIDPDILARVDRAAKRLGISRSAFIVQSAAEKLERME
jgi:hypothetical protein